MAELTERRKKLFTLVMVLLPIILPYSIGEIYLRVRGDLSTYTEKIGRGYTSYYNQKFDDKLWRYGVNSKVVIDHDEFSFTHHSNELGIFEQKPFSEDTGVVKIITLGDSFTEGIGAPYDSSWPRALESQLTATGFGNGRPVEVYNAGVSGSDPILNFMMLKEHLIRFEPDMVIQAFNASELSDYAYRGGMERYRNDRMEFKKGPWWEPIYRFSYLARLLIHSQFGYNFMLITDQEQHRLYTQSIEVYRDLVKNQYQPLADSMGIHTLYLVQPMPDDIRFGCCYYQYLTGLDSVLKEDGQLCVDVFDPMQKVVGEDLNNKYSWSLDRHYNSKGYKVLGELVADTILKLESSGELILF